MSKPTVIFLHGGPGFKDYLSPFFKQYIDRINPVFYDQNQGPEVDLKNLVDQLDLKIDSLDCRPWLFGHSWGGVLGVEYAKNHQTKLAGIALLGTGLSSDQWLQYRGELDLRGLQDAAPEDIFLAENEREIGRPFLKKIESEFSEETFWSIFNQYLEVYDLLPDLALIQIPILNFYGEEDLRFSPQISKSFKTYNDRVKDFSFPNSGHFSFLTASNRERIINEICKEHTSRN